MEEFRVSNFKFQISRTRISFSSVFIKPTRSVGRNLAVVEPTVKHGEKSEPCSGDRI